MDNWVSEYLRVVKDRLGLSSDAELAAEFGFGKSTFATWRRRGDIPPPALTRLADRVGHDLTTGDEVLFALSVSQAALLMRALFTYVVMVRREEIDLGDLQTSEFDDLLWWAGHRHPFEKYLMPVIKEKTSQNVRVGEVFRELKEMVDRGELATAEDLIAVSTEWMADRD